MKLRRTMKAQSPKKREKRKEIIIIIKKKEEDPDHGRGHAARISVRGYVARRASRP